MERFPPTIRFVSKWMKKFRLRREDQELEVTASVSNTTRAQVLGEEKHWFEEKIKSGVVCSRCRRADMLTIDHIIPDMIMALLGVDVLRHFDPNNLQILCRPCNTIKANRLDFANPKTKPLLIHYLEPL